jgi:hypothetical protein
MKRRKWRHWNSVLGIWGHGEVKQGATRGVVRCCCTKGAFYRLGEPMEGRGDGARCTGIKIFGFEVVKEVGDVGWRHFSGGK